MPFPNPDTQFKPGAPGRPRGVLVGKARAKKLRRAQAEAEAARGKALPVTTKPRAYFQKILDDATLPTELRMAAARVLLQFERPEDDPPRQPSSVDWEKLGPLLTPAEREAVRKFLTLAAATQNEKTPRAEPPMLDGSPVEAETLEEPTS